MNAGKSFLLNMLTQHFDREHFKTADQRETAEIKRLETNDFIYLDTPGLDANNTDDLLAKQGIGSADIVLYVHQPRGEFEQVEMEFLQQLRSDFGEQADSNIVVVISKIDKESPEKIDQIVLRVREQCEELQKWSPSVLAVSNIRYQAGKSKLAPNLIAQSGMDTLIQTLDKQRPLIEQTRGIRAHADSLRLSLEIDQFHDKLVSERKALRESLTEHFAPFNAQMEQLHQFLKESITSYNKI